MEQICSFYLFQIDIIQSKCIISTWAVKEDPVNACRFCRYYDLSDQNTSLLHVIEKKKSPAVCINDSQKVEAYDRVKRELNEAFLKAFPKKSSFETDGAGEKH